MGELRGRQLSFEWRDELQAGNFVADSRGRFRSVLQHVQTNGRHLYRMRVGCG